MGLLAATIRRLTMLLLTASVCLASSVRADDQDEFNETIKHAVVEYEGGNWGEAHALFVRAHDLNPSARTWRGLGLASFELRHYLDAIKELRAALEDWRKPLSPAQRREVDSVLARAEQYVVAYRVRLEPPQAGLLLDNQPVQLQDGWLRVDPGEHLLIARADGYEEYRMTLRPEAGMRADLPIALLVRQQGAAPHVANEQPPRPTHLPVLVPQPERRRAMLGAGGAALAIGIAFEIWAWRIYAARVSRGEELVNALPSGPTYESAQSGWAELRAPLLGFGIAGTALSSLGATLLSLGARRERLPWWLAGLSASTGAGLTVWGVTDLVRGACESIDPRVCTINDSQRERGTLVLLSSAPLLMVPLTKLARGSGRATKHVDLQITTQARGMVLQGRW